MNNSDPSSPPTKRIFVTVGTTQFDPLIQTITSPTFFQILPPSYTHLKIQYGNGQHPPLFPPNEEHITHHTTTTTLTLHTPTSHIQCQAYPFKPSLINDIQSCDLVISHAGAGSIMEGLASNKKLVVVINSTLMDNHQRELADALSSRGYLMCVDDPKELLDERIWNRIEGFVPKEFPEGDLGRSFSELLDDQMGFSVREE